MQKLFNVILGTVAIASLAFSLPALASGQELVTSRSAPSISVPERSEVKTGGKPEENREKANTNAHPATEGPGTASSESKPDMTERIAALEETMRRQGA